MRTPITDYKETKGLVYFARMLDKIRLKAKALQDQSGVYVSPDLKKTTALN